ncbi:unnamed protein product [Phytophthora lilii]|uniref:Unnamed protein product n=1 Tax=Phytophthora lilii TaxID=2077276 RepID=A0A9W6TFA8_9STRA|nr:unnamed protein product [Phytophthora lilii]
MTRKRKANASGAASSPSLGAGGSETPRDAEKVPAIPPMSTQVSFKEMQRLHAMRMELFGFGGWLASALVYGACNG